MQVEWCFKHGKCPKVLRGPPPFLAKLREAKEKRIVHKDVNRHVLPILTELAQ